MEQAGPDIKQDPISKLTKAKGLGVGVAESVHGLPSKHQAMTLILGSHKRIFCILLLPWTCYF
jgi:hypothetical protein